MKVKSIRAILLIGAMCASCVENKTEPSNARGGKTLAGTADTTKADAKAQGEVRLPQAPIVVARPAVDADKPDAPAAANVASAAAGTSADADTSDIPLAPKDAQWTLLCTTFSTPDHIEASRELKATLIAKSGMREWYIVHESNQSRLYYGFYRSISDTNDAAETARAKSDRQKIDAMADAGGMRPFRACQFVQLGSPDPEAPPQWNLVNAPKDKVWTLMIGAYKDSPDRKKLAVEAVREAREKYGEEAYYYHGDTVSNVFVGTWPAKAVEETRVDAKKGVNTRQDPVLVLPPGMKADGSVRNSQGAVRAVGVTYKPVDPELLKKIAQYPNMGVNGDFLSINVGGKKRLQGSMVMSIPRPSDRRFDENAPAAAADEPHPFAQNQDAVRQDEPRDPDAVKVDPGRLRSVGRKK
jgi:hypothetical protein